LREKQSGSKGESGMKFWWARNKDQVEHYLKLQPMPRAQKFIYLQTEEDVKQHPAKESEEYLIFAHIDLPIDVLKAGGYENK
jgi:hypothetical protein